MIVLWTAESTAWFVAFLAGSVLIARRVFVGPQIAWPEPRWIVVGLLGAALAGYVYVTIAGYVDQVADLLTR
jgi:hypothetical protein